jgi:formylmethanofuran dehydrogenase subunit E
MEVDAPIKIPEKVIEFHGHTCPGITYGYRASLVALKEFGQRAKDEEIVAIVENDSCAVDAIQVMTGCTFGKGNLIFRNYGKQVYTFLKHPSGEGVRIAVKYKPLKETEEEKEAWKRFSSGDRSKDVLRIVSIRKAKKIKHLLHAPDDEIFNIERIKEPLPPKARLYPSVQCFICGEKVMEPRARVLNGEIVCIPCSERNK